MKLHNGLMENKQEPNVLIITSEWPSEEHPNAVPFLTQHVKYVKEEGVNVDIFHFRGNRNPINYVLAWFQVRQTKVWKKANILHAHWGQSGLITLFSKKKKVVTFHGSDLHGILNGNHVQSLQGKILISISKFIAGMVDCAIVVSNELGKRLVGKNKVVRVIPMGVDPDLFRPMAREECRDRLNLDKNKKIILFLSNPDRPEKQYWLAEKAANELKLKRPEWDIELLPVFKVSHRTVPLFIHAANVLLLTSNYEGAPTVIKETIACNVPIVSTDVGDVRAKIEGVDGCFVCTNHDVSCLTAGLEKAIEHAGKTHPSPDLLASLDERQNVKRVKKIYYELLS